MHRADKIGISDGESGRGANDRVNAAEWADSGPAHVLDPLFCIADREGFCTKEAAANVAAFQLRSMVGGMAVSGIDRVAWKTHG